VFYDLKTSKLANVIAFETEWEREIEIGRRYNYPPLGFGECFTKQESFKMPNRGSEDD
jgi:hypothetical protein